MSLREHAKAKTTNSEAKGAIIAGCRKVGIVMGVAGVGEGGGAPPPEQGQSGNIRTTIHLPTWLVIKLKSEITTLAVSRKESTTFEIFRVL